jgi:hypothetical protein
MSTAVQNLFVLSVCLAAGADASAILPLRTPHELCRLQRSTADLYPRLQVVQRRHNLRCLPTRPLLGSALGSRWCYPSSSHWG